MPDRVPILRTLWFQSEINSYMPRSYVLIPAFGKRMAFVLLLSRMIAAPRGWRLNCSGWSARPFPAVLPVPSCGDSSTEPFGLTHWGGDSLALIRWVPSTVEPRRSSGGR